MLSAAVASDFTGALLSGSRRDLATAAGGGYGTTAQMSRDVGATISADFCAALDIRYTTTQEGGNITLRLRGSNDSGFSTSESQTASIATSDLLGPQSRDYVFATTFSSGPYKYYEFGIAPSDTTNTDAGCSIALFGTAFDFGREPVYQSSMQFQASAWDYDTTRRFTLTWEAITDAVYNDFDNTALKYQDLNHLLFWDQNDYVFDGDRLIYARVLDVKVAPIKMGYRRLTLSLEEVI